MAEVDELVEPNVAELPPVETRYFIGVTAGGLRVSTTIGPARFRAPATTPLPMASFAILDGLTKGVDTQLWPVGEEVFRVWADDDEDQDDDPDVPCTRRCGEFGEGECDCGQAEADESAPGAGAAPEVSRG